MGELLYRYGPPALAWALFLSRRPGDDRARRCVRWVLLGLAVSLTALTPPVYAFVGNLSGIGHLARPIGHGGMLFAAWAAQEFLASMNGLARGARWHAWWVGGAFAVMCVLFALAPGLYPDEPGVLEYCVVYLLGQAPAFGNVIRLGLRYARAAAAPALRIGMRLVVAGAALALLYLVNKVVLTAAARFGFAYPAGDTFVISKVLPAAAHVLVLVGATLPAIVGWARRYGHYQRLGPLWRALYQAEPAIALDPPAGPDVLRVRGLRLRLYRRVIEIRDGLLALHPYREHDVAAAARRHATRAGMRGRRLEATVEAAAVAAALRVRAEGGPPSETAVPVTGGGDLDSDTAFLSEVARAYRKNLG
ncbi:MAG TPA: MAB_1171c family putative transporter [Actinophytocola sp.]|uniref:MAB_1171c family putative transporter n=1 Tax=Actinophytocola sp. TaxID=1872138 RepID=UPI002F95EE54